MAERSGWWRCWQRQHFYHKSIAVWICCCEKSRATETANHCFPACDLSKSEWRIKKWCGNGICRKHECWTTPSIIGDRSERNHFDVRSKTYENNVDKKMLERYNHGVIGMAWDANFRYQMPRPFNVIPSELRTWTILCMEFDRWDDQTASELLPRSDFDMIGVLSEDDWLGKTDWRTYNMSTCCVSERYDTEIWWRPNLFGLEAIFKDGECQWQWRWRSFHSWRTMERNSDVVRPDWDSFEGWKYFGKFGNHEAVKPNLIRKLTRRRLAESNFPTRSVEITVLRRIFNGRISQLHFSHWNRQARGRRKRLQHTVSLNIFPRTSFPQNISDNRH